MVRQIGPQTNAIVSNYLVSQDASDGYFTSIQDAIDQAGVDGKPATIVVKPGTYTENLSITSDAVIQGSIFCQNDPAVVINGTVNVFGNSTNQISNIKIVAPAGAAAVTYSGVNPGSVEFLNCVITSNVNNQNTVSITSSVATSVITFKDCSITNTANFGALGFNANCTLVLAGSTYIGCNATLGIQSVTPRTASIIINGCSTDNYNQFATGNKNTISNVVFDLGYDLATSANGQTISFQDMNIQIRNCSFAGLVTMSGVLGSCYNTSFLSYDGTNLTYNNGTAAFPSDASFNECIFSTSNASAINGNSTGNITTEGCFCINPVTPFDAPDLFNSAIEGTISAISYSGKTFGIQKGLRIQREQNTTTQRLAGLVVSGPINATTSGSIVGSYNSICDVNIGASPAESFGYWSSNAIFNGSDWTTEGNGTSNGGGYISINPEGNLVQAVFPTNGTTASTRTNPSCTVTLTNSEQQFLAVFGGFSGSQEIKTQATYQTTNATPYDLYSVVLNENEAVTISGTIVGATTDHTDACGGTFSATATRSTGNISLVGVPTISLNSTTTANFSIVANTTSQSLILQVVGLSSVDYNWNCFLTYHKILSAT